MGNDWAGLRYRVPEISGTQRVKERGRVRLLSRVTPLERASMRHLPGVIRVCAITCAQPRLSIATWE